jgi:enoyl-CoA hydratase/carnithine racemase
VLDLVVPRDDLMKAARDVAARFASTLNLDAHRGTKERVRADMVKAIAAANDAEFPKP